MNRDRLVDCALLTFSVMCLAVAAACIEWIRTPVEAPDCVERFVLTRWSR